MNNATPFLLHSLFRSTRLSLLTCIGLIVAYSTWPACGQEVKRVGSVDVGDAAKRNSPTCIVFSADSKQIAVGDFQGAAHLFTTAGEKVSVCRQRSVLSGVEAIYFSSGGLLATYHDLIISAFNPVTGKRLGFINISDGGLYESTISPDGRTLAITDRQDKTRSGKNLSGLKMIDLKSRKTLRTVDLNERGPCKLAFDPDGRSLAVVRKGRGVTFFDAATLKNTRTLRARANIKSSYRAIDYSPDGKSLVVTCERGEYELWHLDRDEQYLRNSKHEIETAVFSPTGKYLAIAGGHDKAYLALCDAERGAVQMELSSGHAKMINVVAFSPNGKLMATASHVSTTVHLWDVSALAKGITQPTVKDPTAESSPARPSDWPVAGKPAGSGKGEVANSVVTMAGHRGTVTGLTFLPGENRLVSCSGLTPDNKPAGKLFVWDIATRRTTMKLAERAYVGLDGLMLSPDASRVITWMGAGRVDAWNLSDRIVPLGIRFQRHRSDGVDITSDGKFYVMGGGNDIVVWAIDADEVPERFLKGHKSRIGHVAVSHDSKYVASGAPGEKIHLWQFSTGKLLASFAADTHGTVAFSPKRNIVAFADDDAESRGIVLYDVETGKTTGRLSIADPITTNCISFSQDGKLLAAGDADGTVRVWTLASGKLLHKISAHANNDRQRAGVLALAFSPDSTRLATGGNDTLIHIYPLVGEFDAVVKRNPVRTWHSASGKFTISARLLDHDGTNVRLEKKDGRIVTVPISKLSTADGKYLAARPKAEPKVPTKRLDEK